MLTTQTQVFYSGRSALSLEISRNGIFAVLAPSLQKNENGHMTFNWKEARITKLSISEITYLKEGIKAYYKEGEEAYKKLATFLFGKEEYKNVQFIHVTAKGQKRVGLDSFGGLSFIVSEGKNNVLRYPIQRMDLFRLLEFLDKLIDLGFYYESIIANEERMTALNKIPPALVSDDIEETQKEIKLKPNFNIELVKTALSLISSKVNIEKEILTLISENNLTEAEILQLNELKDHYIKKLLEKEEAKRNKTGWINISTQKAISNQALKKNVRDSFELVAKSGDTKNDKEIALFDKASKYIDTYQDLNFDVEWFSNLYKEYQENIKAF